ncbi:MAG: rRNA maturation RNase YbeY [Candidatus Omnitrophota bacterium]
MNPVSIGAEIEIINLHKRYNLNGACLKSVIKKILQCVNKSRNMTSLDVVFMDDRAIKVLNKRYKGRNRPTDVLSFEFQDEPAKKAFAGEVIISVDRARENSKVFGTDFKAELVLYVIHGILHLFGYDDMSEAKRRVMRRKESEILRYLCTRENLSKVLTPR